MEQNFLNLFPPELRPTISRLYNVILERALLRAYQNLDEETKGRMTQIFTSGTTEEKNKFLKDCLGNLQELMIEEAQKILAEIKK